MKGSQKQELIKRTVELGEKAFRGIFPMIPVEMLKLDMTMPQLKVVLLLYFNGSARMSEIAAALDVSLATATGVVDRLVERELVLRESQPDDRRVVLCRLSDKGNKFMSGLGQLASARFREILETLDPDKLRKFNEAVEPLFQNGTAGKSGSLR